MHQHRSTISIDCHVAVDGFPFGAAYTDLVALLGEPDDGLHNYTGEFEVLYGDAFYRFYADRFVEATFPATHRFNIDGVAVLSVLDWLAAQPDSVDKARFRISRAHGIAYDYRDPAHGSVTVFEQGRWDALLGSQD